MGSKAPKKPIANLIYTGEPGSCCNRVLKGEDSFGRQETHHGVKRPDTVLAGEI